MNLFWRVRRSRRLALILALAACTPACTTGHTTGSAAPTAVIVAGDGKPQGDAATTLASLLRKQKWGIATDDVQVPTQPSFYETGGGANLGILFFYVGEGTPGAWDLPPGQESASAARFGESANDPLRYLWFCSCSTFADGPHCPGAGRVDYFAPGGLVCPGKSAPESSPVSAVRNWKGALGPDVRLACGLSTLTLCTADTAEWLWHNFDRQHMDVADAFLVALHTDDDIMPVCLARGGRSPRQSGLYDSTFDPSLPDAGWQYYHLEAVRPFASNPPQAPTIDPQSTRWTGGPAGPDPEGVAPSCYAAANRSDQTSMAAAAAARRCLAEKSQSLDGDEYCDLGELGEPQLDHGLLDEHNYLEAADDFVRETGWCPAKGCYDERGYRLMITSSRSGDDQHPEHYQKAVMVTLRVPTTMPGSDGNPMSVLSLGDRGWIVLELDNQAHVVNASWRPPARGALRQLTAGILSFVDAEQMALGRLPNERYKTIKKSLGLRIDSQGSLAPFFVFDFVPANPSMRSAPQHVEIPAAPSPQ